MKVAPNDIYDYFVTRISSTNPTRKYSHVSISPILDDHHLNRVKKAFGLPSDERVMFIRNYATKDGDVDLVFTDRAIYHNQGGIFTVLWKDLSCVHLDDDGICFYRGYRRVLVWEAGGILDGVKNVKRDYFIGILDDLASYAPVRVIMAKTIADTFCRAMSPLKGYYQTQEDRLGEIDPSKPYKPEYDIFVLKQTLPAWSIPDHERILLLRVSNFWNDKASFIVTDSAIYLSPKISFKWHSLKRVARIDDVICFYDRKGACHTVAMYDIIKYKKGLFRKNEEEINAVGTTLVKAFNYVIDSLNNAKVPSLPSFTRSYEKHEPTSFSSIQEEVNRCPYCGSRSFHLNADYERRDREARRKHDLEQVGGAVLSYLITRKPSGYSGYSRLMPIVYDCEKCGKKWTSNHE